MTTLGKILAIVNLVFSIAVGALIVFVYVARTNWHAAYDAAEKQLKVAQADYGVYKAESAQYEQQARQAQQAAEAAKADAARVQGEVAGIRQDFNTKLTTEVTKGKQLQTTITAQAGELDNRQKEVNYLRGQVARRDDDLRNKEKQVEDMRAAMVSAQLDARATHGQNDRLLALNERLSRELQEAQRASSPALAGSSTGQKPNPPSEDVEGIVKKAEGDLVTISLGSDAGIAVGNTLEVYRLKPDPNYLGTIQILAVRPNEAVGKPVTRLRGVIQPGDRVSSNILSRR
jgi:multidrug efflux pump subunit AcrA (membrane-fusion protein)